MTAEIIIAAIGVIVSVLLYFAGLKRGERQERLRQEHERGLERERQQHERGLERERQEHEMTSKVADEYVGMTRRHYDSGITAMARLGLAALGSDALIRRAIEEMRVRSNTDPWSGKAALVEDLDLVAFFSYVREHRVNFFNTPAEKVVEEVRRTGGVGRAA